MAEGVEKGKDVAATADSRETSGNDTSLIEETRKPCVKFRRFQSMCSNLPET